MIVEKASNRNNIPNQAKFFQSFDRLVTWSGDLIELLDYHKTVNIFRYFCWKKSLFSNTDFSNLENDFLKICLLEPRI